MAPPWRKPGFQPSRGPCSRGGARDRSGCSSLLRSSTACMCQPFGCRRRGLNVELRRNLSRTSADATTLSPTTPGSLRSSSCPAPRTLQPHVPANGLLTRSSAAWLFVAGPHLAGMVDRCTHEQRDSATLLRVQLCIDKWRRRRFELAFSPVCSLRDSNAFDTLYKRTQLAPQQSIGLVGWSAEQCPQLRGAGRQLSCGSKRRTGMCWPACRTPTLGYCFSQITGCRRRSGHGNQGHVGRSPCEGLPLNENT
jgi:hypothetical protein